MHKRHKTPRRVRTEGVQLLKLQRDRERRHLYDHKKAIFVWVRGRTGGWLSGLAEQEGPGFEHGCIKRELDTIF